MISNVAGFVVITASSLGCLVSTLMCAAAVRDWRIAHGGRRRPVAAVLVIKALCIWSAQVGILSAALGGWQVDASAALWPVAFEVRQVGIASASVALLAWALVDASYRHWADEW